MVNYNPLDAFDMQERLNFSLNFNVQRPTILDTIFPDIKTEYLQAEYYRLMDGGNLPDVAYVHAPDTEALIGERPDFQKVLAEKLFIKKKINQSERLQMLIDKGVPDDARLTNWVFNDAANLFEGVLARTKIMKGQALSDGELKIKENNLDMKIDLGVPTENKIAFGQWKDAETDIMGDIEKAVNLLTDKGYIPNKMLTSKKNIRYMRSNTGIQTAALGKNNARLLTVSELNNFLYEEFGLTVDSCDERFNYRSADGTKKTGRYYKEDKVTIYAANPAGDLGIGLWGPTPEEMEYRQFLEHENRSFITLSMWATPDPVAKWTKASGMFIPVSPLFGAMVIGTVQGE